MDCCVILGLNNLGYCYHDKGMLDASARAHEDCLEIRRLCLPRHHPNIADS